jgi:hypothetical protein
MGRDVVSQRWVKLDVGYFSHPKVVGLHPSAKLLHIASILWSAEHLTDGYVPSRALHRLVTIASLHTQHRATYARWLVDAGLWDECDPSIGGWIVHDFAEHNHSSTRAAVEHSRELTRKRVERWRAAAGNS